MPSTFSALDHNLPRFTGEEPLEQRVKLLQDYQYQLLEQLRYIIGNLDMRNFNSKALADWTGEITEPIYARIEDTEGNINQLAITAQGMQAQISNNAGDITQLAATAKGLQAQISDADGNIASLQATATSLQTQITNNDGDISSLRQTATSLQTQISNANGDISSLQQTATSLQTQISNANGDISSLQQTATTLRSLIANNASDISAIEQSVDSIDLTVSNGESSSTIRLRKDGVTIASEVISFTGTVLFEDLETEGQTIIHGGNIDTDTLYLDTLYGDYIFLMDSNGYAAARFAITGSSSYQGGALDILTGAMRITTYGGDIYFDSASGAALQLDEEVQVTGNLIPNGASQYSCGTKSFPWSDVYSTDGTISSSDREKKFDIDYDMSWSEELFDRLRPCSFRRTVGDSYRRHTGLIAQDVKAARDELGIPDTELAAYCQWEGSCGLRYEELIAPLIWQVQKLNKRVGALEGA